MANKNFKGISVITAGPAIGHGMVIDAETLAQVVAKGNEAGQVKVLSDHSSSVSNIIGYLENFALDGGRVRADLTLLESHEGFAYFSELLSTLPGQIGFSISFSGVPRTADDGTQLADVQTLFSVDLVTTPAANPTGVYSARVDNKINAVTETTPALVAKLEAPVEVAPATPAAPAPAAFSVEAAFSDLRAELKAAFEALTVKLESRLSAVVVEDAPADDAPEPETAPEPVAAEAKAEVKELSQPAPVPSAIAAQVIELEASRGIKALETSETKNFSRAELIAQFNAEKDQSRARQIFNQIKLAR